MALRALFLSGNSNELHTDLFNFQIATNQMITKLLQKWAKFLLLEKQTLTPLFTVQLLYVFKNYPKKLIKLLNA